MKAVVLVCVALLFVICHGERVCDTAFVASASTLAFTGLGKKNCADLGFTGICCMRCESFLARIKKQGTKQLCTCPTPDVSFRFTPALNIINEQNVATGICSQVVNPQFTIDSNDKNSVIQSAYLARGISFCKSVGCKCVTVNNIEADTKTRVKNIMNADAPDGLFLPGVLSLERSINQTNLYFKQLKTPAVALAANASGLATNYAQLVAHYSRFRTAQKILSKEATGRRIEKIYSKAKDFLWPLVQGRDVVIDKLNAAPISKKSNLQSYVECHDFLLAEANRITYLAYFVLQVLGSDKGLCTGQQALCKEFLDAKIDLEMAEFGNKPTGSSGYRTNDGGFGSGYYHGRRK